MSIAPRIFQSLDRDLARAFRSFERDPFFRSANWPAPFAPLGRQSALGNAKPRTMLPDVDVSETKDTYVVEAEVPGFPKDQISIEFKDDMLTLRGQYETERTEGQPPVQEGGVEQEQQDSGAHNGGAGSRTLSERKYWSIERQVGSFERSFAFPQAKVDADNIKAAFHNGLLTVTLPKVQVELEGKSAKRIANIMTFDSLAKYTDESIGVCKDFIWFLKKKAQLDAEYAKNLAKLCQSGMSAFSNGASPSVGAGGVMAGIMGAGSAPGSPALGTSQQNILSAQGVGSMSREDRLLVLKTSLWKSFTDSVALLNDSANGLRSSSSGVISEIINPIQMLIKDMETARRAIVEESTKQTKELQENYTALRKSKQIHDDALNTCNEAKEALLKVQRSPNAKEKEVEKLKQRAQQCQDKYDSVLISHRQTEETCKSAQLVYYNKNMPALLEALYRKEEERCNSMHAALRNWYNLERQNANALNKATTGMGDAVDSVEVTADLEDVYADHMDAANTNAEDLFRGGDGNVSVRSIVNPIKSGRLWKKAESHDSWKQRFFVLTGDRTEAKDASYQPGSGRLYYFDSEDGLKPKGIIDLALASVYAVDQSMYLDKQHLFVISYTATSTESTGLVKKHRKYYLSAASAEEKALWIASLRRYCMCCVPCVSSALINRVSMNYLPPSDAFKLPKPTEREKALRLNRSLRLWIMEGRDLSSLAEQQTAVNGATAGPNLAVSDVPPQLSITAAGVGEAILNSLSLRGTLNTYVSVLFNGCPIARTTVKSSSAPFFGEDFFLDDLAYCENELRLVVRQPGRRWEAELGFAFIPLERFKQQLSESAGSEGSFVSENMVHKKFDAWIPLQLSGNSDYSGSASALDSTNAALRISAIYSEEIILPLSEYSGLLFCLSDYDFGTLQTFSRYTDKCITFARDDFARSLVKILAASDLDTQAVKQLVALEVDSIEDPNIIFRGNTLITKLLDQFMKFYGAEFLKDTLSGPIKLVYERTARQESCEVDPTRLERPDEELLRKHQKRLFNWVQLFWDAINNSVSNCPSKIRDTLNIVREVVSESFARRFQASASREVQFSCVSGFIFLRFFCPAILSPKMFDLWPEISENALASRTLTLIAKTIQNLANLSDFKSKEPYMEFMNSFIHANLDQMKFCILQFSSRSRPSGGSPGTQLHTVPRSDLCREYNYMFLLIKNNLAELRQCHEELVSNNNSSKEDLYRLKYRDVDIGVLENVFKTINTMNSVNQLYLQTFLANQAAIASQPHFEKQFAALQSMNSMFAANAGGPGASGLRVTTPKRSAEPVRANSQRTAISTPSLLTRGDSGYLATPISDFKRSNTNESSLSENSTAVVTQSSRASKKLPVPSPVKVREKQEQPVDLGEFSQVMADVLNERLAIGSAEFSTSVPAIDNMVAVSQCSTIVAEASSKDSPLYTDESLGKQKLQMESADSIDMAEMDGNRTGKSLSKKFLKKLASSVNSYNSGNKNTDLECPTDTSPSRPPKDWKK